MTHDQRFCKSMVLLIGSNPLPNYLTVHLRKPENVHLVHTDETKELAENLSELFLAQLTPKPQVTLHRLGESTRPDKIGGFFDELYQRLAENEENEFELNYTGGTKVMAAYARMCYDSEEDPDSRASYLDDADGKLRYDTGYSLDLDDKHTQLSLDVMLKMHGHSKSSSTPFDPGHPMTEDSKKIFMRAVQDKKIAEDLFYLLRDQKTEHKVEYKDAKKAPGRNPVEGLILSKNEYPAPGDNENEYKLWRHFLQGGWLELWTAAILRPLLPQECEIHTNLHCSIGGTSREFEIDVAFIHRNRLYMISCTLEDRLPVCKSKLFEATMRARQMGGDLARVAFVCMLEGTTDGMDKMDALRKDISRDWASEKYIEVFGRTGLLDWFNGNTERLQKWLYS